MCGCGAPFSFLKVFATFKILFYFTIHHLHQPLLSTIFFSDNNVSDYSKEEEEEEVSSEGNEDSSRDISIQLDQLKLVHFQIHPVLIVLI